MYGIRLILKQINSDDADRSFLSMETKGQIIRDKAHVFNNCGEKKEFSAWRVIQTKCGENWQDYDGFDLSKIEENADDEEFEMCDGENCPDRDDDCECD